MGLVRITSEKVLDPLMYRNNTLRKHVMGGKKLVKSKGLLFSKNNTFKASILFTFQVSQRAANSMRVNCVQRISQLKTETEKVVIRV